MVQVGAGQAQRAFVFVQGNPGFATEIFAALVARRVSGRDEHLQVTALLHLIPSPIKAKYPQTLLLHQGCSVLGQDKINGQDLRQDKQDKIK